MMNQQIVQGSLVRVLPEWRPQDVPVHVIFQSARYVTPNYEHLLTWVLRLFELPGTCRSWLSGIAAQPKYDFLGSGRSIFKVNK